MDYNIITEKEQEIKEKRLDNKTSKLNEKIDKIGGNKSI